MSSLPTIEQVNNQNYLELLKKFDPSLYLIKIALNETRVDPGLVIPWIRAISNIAIGTGYGQVLTNIRDGAVVQIEGVESTQMRIKILTIT